MILANEHVNILSYLTKMNKFYVISSQLILIICLTAISANANFQQQQDAYIQRTDTNGRPQLMVAIYCGGGTSVSSKQSSFLYYNQYLDINTRKWITDRDASAYCTRDSQEVLNYCRKVYPNHDIRNIVESSRPYKIENWCKLGSSKKKCRTRLSVRPFRCLEGTFQSDALLVPEKCLFDHVHNKSICEISEHWNKTASENCQLKQMKLQSFAMLQPCGLGVFSGVEFVCCPLNQQQTLKNEAKAKESTQSEGNSFAQATNGLLNWQKDSKYSDVDDKFNSIKVDDDNLKKQHEKSDNEESDDQVEGEEEEEEEYEDDEDEYDDDSSSWNGDKSSSTSSTTSTTTTTTTSTTENPIDRYLSHFELAHEHDDFRKAELAVEGNYRDKITHVMKEWSQSENHYEDMKKRDPIAAEEFKKKMTKQFQKTIEALEEEGAAQRHQLASMHAERAMAIINRRKKAAMDCLTQALDKMPIRTRQVERCIAKLLRALEKDRSHTLRQYKNLLNLNTREALREKKIILDHLMTLNRAANQSIAMLDRSPVLVDKLKNKIIAMWHKLRNVPLNEPIVRESELKIMEKYEEEVAQRKIEHERQRLAEQEAIQEAPQESPQSPVKSNNDDSSKAPSNEVSEINNGGLKSTTSNSEAVKEQQQQQMTTSNRPDLSVEPTTTSPRMQNLVAKTSSLSNDIYQVESTKFSHLKANPSHHELSYLVKHEPIGSQMRFSYPTILVSACTLVILVALFGVKYYNTHSARSYRRQGFSEVGNSCPEVKNVTNMQFNGYENPAYKFYEAEA